MRPPTSTIPPTPIRKQNPLGKIPALMLDDGSTWYDSRVILEYLDHLAGGGRIIPRDAPARFAVLRLQALCDGMLDAGVLIVYEAATGRRKCMCSAWLERQADKVERALDALEAAPPTLTPVPDVGQIALACVLGYGDLRFGGAGARTIRSWSPGSTPSPRRCRPSRRPRSRHNKAPEPGLRGFAIVN